MPFKSQAQRRFMYAKHPGIAERWQDHTPKGAALPEKISFALMDHLHKLSAAVLRAPIPKFDIGKAIAEHVPTQAAPVGSLSFSSLANKPKPPPLPNRIPVPPARMQAATAPTGVQGPIVKPPVGQLAPRAPGSPFRPGDVVQGTSLPVKPDWGRNLTQEGGAATHEDYQSLPADIRQAVEAHPHIAQRGMTPGQAATLMSWGSHEGEGLHDSMRRQLGMSAPVPPPKPTVGTSTIMDMPQRVKAAMWDGFLDEMGKEAGRFTWLKDRALDLTNKDSDTRKHISEKVHHGVEQVQHSALNAKEKARGAIHTYTEKKAGYLQSPAQLATPKTRVLSAAPPNKSFVVKSGSMRSTTWSSFAGSLHIEADPWLSEMSKYAASLALPPHMGGSKSSSGVGGGGGVNIGQWWEQHGGPHLATGGSVDDLKKMMDKAGIPKNVQKRFVDTAEKRYQGARASKARSDSYSAVNLSGMSFKSRKANIAAQAIAAAIAAGSLAHTVKNFKQKGEPEKPTFKKGLIGSALVGAPIASQVGWGVGRRLMQTPDILELLDKHKMSPKEIKILTHLIPAGVALAAGTAGTLGVGSAHGAMLGLNKLEKYHPRRGQERVKEVKEFGPINKVVSALTGSGYTAAAAAVAPRYAPAIALGAHGIKLLLENTTAGTYHEAKKYLPNKKPMKKAAEAL